jgi:SH3 domain-containing YSC84-like protein 1
MQKFLTCLTCILFVVAPLFAEAASASDQTKDDDRLRNCGTVLKEILDLPDNIPQDLLDKADCVVVFPSVLKAAFIVGGSYGRGAISGARGILASKVKLGGDTSVAAGPVGRDASADTDATLRSEILSYSRARGLFAGVSLEGSTIRPDNGDNHRVYCRKISARDIVLSGKVPVPPAPQQLISTLDAKTPKA